MKNKTILIVIILASLSLGMYNNSIITIDPLSLLEKTRRAEIILYAKIISIESEKYTRYNDYDSPKSLKTFNRFANYEIVEVLKGEYDNKYIRIDYHKVNSSYAPSVRYPYAKAEPNEEVVFFLNKDMTFVRANQGKAKADITSLAKIKKIVKYSLDYADVDERKKVLDIIDLINTVPSERSSLFMELKKVDNNKYGVEISVLLEHEDRLVRQSALEALKGTQIKSLVPVIIKISSNDLSNVRRTAARVLGSMNDDIAEKALLNLTKDEHDEVRAAAIFSLPRTDENKNVLINSLKDQSAKVRYAGLNSLRDFQSKKSAKAIINLLEDSDRRVRNKAFETIAYYATHEAIGALTKALMSDDTEIQRMAIAAISHQNRNFPNSMNDSIIIDLIIGIVKDTNDLRQKMIGIRALGYLNTIKALPILKDNLVDSNSRIRMTSANAIVQMNGVSLIDHMEYVLENEEDRKVARLLKNSIDKLKKSNSQGN